MSALRSFRASRRANLIGAVAFVAVGAVLPFFFGPLDGFINTSILALAYVVMALGLNVVVGFAGLLDLGYVAFYALGAYAVGWFASGHFDKVNQSKGIHVLVTGNAAATALSQKPTPGIHVTFLLVLVIAVVIAAIVGAVIGLPTLRLRGDYIAIVTLAFGEIIGKIAVNGDQLNVGIGTLTEGRNSISPVDQVKLPFLSEFDQASNIRPYYWFGLALVLVFLFVNFRLRESRLGRAWIALREDEVAAASMGVPLVRTKIMAYAVGAATGGVAGAFLGTYINSVNADSFKFSFSIFVLSMVILGGLSSVWGVVIGAISLTFINYYLIPDVLNGLPGKIGLNFDLTELSFGIFGFLLVLMMILRPEGLIPERRRKQELTEGLGTDETIYEATA